ncbi:MULTISPECIES: RNA polymerase sigma factor [unclassified Pseudofrankia]|uniref:RNA polymerase sigma factor n=1 Tax=unclassified Pseudofrankia TaxID=2994372 RepID=UPI0008DA4155|nr:MULTISPECIES: hypothetical protein [unclassified Pseudofrankia]MDT3442751.1 sigma-70 family RNA polymerase sigma factor [Pseudofrankia sp. BMG5.37]OHV44204.1 hypothetical protein BCD48_25880 [Pseudofrankia sp. BMG5.36]
MADDSAVDDDRASRLAGDAALYARLIEVGFAGPDYEVVADALARYGHQVLHAWLVSGQITQECARRGLGGVRRLAAGEITLTRDDIDDLVQETLITALARFQDAGREGRGWSPKGGAKLSTYFIGGCVLAFGGTVYPRWERQRLSGALVGEGVHALDLRDPALRDPADLFTMREDLAAALPPPGRLRTAVLLSATGHTYEEIARFLGEDVTPRAVEGMLYRFRQGLKGGTRS